MSDKRSGARQTGAPALTLTRRQQKRARKHQGARRTAAPAAQQKATATRRTEAATERAAATTERAGRADDTALEVRPEQQKAVAPADVIQLAARREHGKRTREQAQPRTSSPATEQPEPRQRQKQLARPERSESAEVKRQGTRKPAATQTPPAAPPVRRAPGKAADAGERDEPRPAPAAASKAPRVSKRTRPIPSVRLPAPAESPSASGRRYPTLASMATAPKLDVPEAARRRTRRDRIAVPGSRERQDVARPVPTGEPPRIAETAGEWEDVRTEAMPVVPPQRPAARRGVPTRRLRDEMPHGDEAPRGNEEVRAGKADEPAGGAIGVRVRARRSARLAAIPQADLLMLVAVTHAGVAAAAALAGAAMLVLNAPGARWPLSLTVVVGAGGWLAYALAQRGERRAAGAALLASQVGVLVWLMALLGPRAALLAVVPALALLSLRLAGRRAPAAAVAGSFALYITYVGLTLGGFVAPSVSLDVGGAALVDGLALAVGLGATLFGVLDVASSRARMERAAQARQYEARVLRARLTQLTQQVEDGGERLDAALARALHGNGIAPLVTEGALSPLAETVSAAAERLKTLQRDREDRLRLEGAVRAVTRAVERAWLGLPWSWPEWSGTAMDELVALLRTPRPREAQTTAETHEAWSEETPTLLQLPPLDRGTPSRPWEDETPPMYPYVAKAANGWSQPLEQPYGGARTPVRSSAQITPLPWNEWNQWPNWEG